MGASYKGIVHAKCRKCLAETDFSNIPVYISGAFGSRKKITKSPIIPADNVPD
jgi:hypothetical protein